MLTIFAIPKPFIGKMETIQLNALQSWSLLEPACEIILCGDETGVKEAAADFGARHLHDIECNEYGTPLLNSAFEKVVRIARDSPLCYINADIILLNDLLRAVRRVRFPEFMMVGQRHNVELNRRWDFHEPSSSIRLRQLVSNEGSVATHYFLDYFVFTPNGSLEKLPPFAVGRPRWDNWFVYNARRLGIPVIDASRAIMAIHQDHDYSHIPKNGRELPSGSEAQWEGPEARRNRALSADSMGAIHQFTMLDATHIMTPGSLLPAYSMRHVKKRWHSLPILYPRTRPLVQVADLILRPVGRLNKGIRER